MRCDMKNLGFLCFVEQKQIYPADGTRKQYAPIPGAHCTAYGWLLALLPFALFIYIGESGLSCDALYSSMEAGKDLSLSEWLMTPYFVSFRPEIG